MALRDQNNTFVVVCDKTTECRGVPTHKQLDTRTNDVLSRVEAH